MDHKVKNNKITPYQNEFKVLEGKEDSIGQGYRQYFYISVCYRSGSTVVAYLARYFYEYNLINCIIIYI